MKDAWQVVTSQFSEQHDGQIIARPGSNLRKDRCIRPMPGGIRLEQVLQGSPRTKPRVAASAPSQQWSNFGAASCSCQFEHASFKEPPCLICNKCFKQIVLDGS